MFKIPLRKNYLWFETPNLEYIIYKINGKINMQIKLSSLMLKSYLPEL